MNKIRVNLIELNLPDVISPKNFFGVFECFWEYFQIATEKVGTSVEWAENQGKTAPIQIEPFSGPGTTNVPDSYEPMIDPVTKKDSKGTGRLKVM